ncbi:alpha/beta fold hydrolase [Devosia sp. LjRoot16]|uniref:alpha/beta hydrolase n=1 Tax=Devosia sp. LjRoot16 TaxID=3342271 RepID=UPI003ECD93B8
MSRAGNWWWTPVAGAIFGIGAIAAAPVTGLAVAGPAGVVQADTSWVAPFLGSFVVAAIVWWLLIGWPRRLSLVRAAFAGALVGLCSYPVVLAIAEFGQGEPVDVATLGVRSFGILELAALTILTTGFVAMVIMAGVGVIAALLLGRVYPPAPAWQPVPWLLKAGAITLTAIVLLLGGAFAWLTQLPLDAGALGGNRPMNNPAADYEVAATAFAAIAAEEAKLPLHPECGSRLFTHGTRVAKAVVYLHGLTNCPLQADELARQLFEAGYNVYVPRWPGHGEADQMTLALTGLSAEQMVERTDAAIDLARGLGDEVTVVGMSAGGAMTAWAAQYRADVAHTVAVSPFLGPHFVPPWANRAAANLLLRMPNMMLLWNPLEPEGAPGMEHSYPRIPTHALAQFMRLGEVLESAAQQAPPQAAGLGMLLNDADFAVNNALARQLVAAWRAKGRAVDLEVLPRSDLLPHDLVDPRMPGARTELVYPVLLEMIARRPQ